jgi:uncharacterized protein (TIGR02246 family)
MPIILSSQNVKPVGREFSMSRYHRDETAIRMLVERWHRATGIGDLADILPLMAEDVVFLVPERPPMRGRAAFAHALKGVLESHTLTSTGDIQEVTVSGDLAYCWTNLTVIATPIDGTSPTVRKGPTLSVFSRSPDGSWVLLRDANMLAADTAELEMKVDNLERELMADGPGG